MIGRSVDHGIRILAAVALLLAVMLSPIRPTQAPHTAPSHNHLPRNFAILEIWHGGQFAMSARPFLREADSLQADIEDELDADIEDELTLRSPLAALSVDVAPLCLSRALLRRGQLRRRAPPSDRSAAESVPRQASSASRGRDHLGGCPSLPARPVTGPALSLIDWVPSSADAPVPARSASSRVLTVRKARRSPSRSGLAVMSLGTHNASI